MAWHNLVSHTDKKKKNSQHDLENIKSFLSPEIQQIQLFAS